MSFIKGFMSLFDWFSVPKSYQELSDNLDSDMQILYDKMGWGKYQNPLKTYILNSDMNIVTLKEDMDTTILCSYTWQDFDNDIEILTNYITSSQWIPDYIVGVKRGGLIPAIKLSHIFDKPLIMMSCQLRDSTDKEVRLYEVEELPKNKNVLIVDDICDSGITFSQIIMKFYSNGFDINNIKTCSLIYNTSQKFVVDYYAEEIDRTKDDRWISFPWEN